MGMTRNLVRNGNAGDLFCTVFVWFRQVRLPLPLRFVNTNYR